jgi:predicted nucleic acid-binding protein
MAETVRPARGLLDTSVVIDLPSIDPARLPAESAISTFTLAELAAGPHATRDHNERARRQQRLQWAEATFDPIPFDLTAARTFGVVFAAAQRSGRKGRRRIVDLMIASVAAANDLPLYTRNATDFRGLTEVVRVVAC